MFKVISLFVILGLCLQVSSLSSCLSTITSTSTPVRASYFIGQPDSTTKTSGSANDKFTLPQSVSVSPSGKIFVADTGNQRVQRFASSAALTTGASAEATFGGIGLSCSAGGFSYPRAVFVDSSDNLWVADSFNNRVLAFSNSSLAVNSPFLVLGQPDFTTCSIGSSSSSMNGAQAVAINSNGTLWVADTGNHRVLKFYNAASKSNGAASDGQFGSSASCTQSTMNAPFGVTAGSDGSLWVSDTNNNRVLRFLDAEAKVTSNADYVLGQTSFTSCSSGTTQSTLKNPGRLYVESTNDALFVPDINNNRLMIWLNASMIASDGENADAQIGQEDFTHGTRFTTSDTSLSNPLGAFFDSSADQLFIACTYDQRVTQYCPFLSVSATSTRTSSPTATPSTSTN